MHPYLAPPSWPDPQPRPGRFAATIVRNKPELLEDRDAQRELSKCSVALIGIPDDTGVVLNFGRAGARNGPAAFRAALTKYGVASPADEQEDRHAYPRVFDAGDVIIGKDIHDTHNRVSEVVLALLERNLFPIAIGGGHDLTFAFVRGVAKAFGALDGLYLDAHLDVRPKVGSGMPFRSLIEGGFVRDLWVVGLDRLSNSREHMEYFLSRGGQAPAHDDGTIRLPDWAHGKSAGQRTFLSLDMDVFDAAYAPGVSAMNPCGLSPAQVERCIAAAAASESLKCFDIMELNPDHDPDGRTARLAVRMFLIMLRGLAARRAGNGA